MQYTTICLELLQQSPETYHQLRRTRMLLPTLEENAAALKRCHQRWTEQLLHARPGSNPSQIASEALEIALKEMEDSLRTALPSNESPAFSLDAAMAFVRKHTPPA